MVIKKAGSIMRLCILLESLINKAGNAMRIFDFSWPKKPRDSSSVFDAEKIFSEEVTPEQFLEICDTDGDSIASARFEPPKIGVGSSNFGKFVVRHKTAKFAVKTK